MVALLKCGAMNNGINCDNLDLKAKSKKQLAAEYGVSVKTLTTWIKGKGLETGYRKILNSAEVRYVYNSLGIPRENVPFKSIIR